MLQIEIKNNFVELGKFLSQFSENENHKNPNVLNNDLFFDDFVNLIQLSQSHNGWYTPENVYFSIQSWAKALTKENLDQWTSSYDFTIAESKTIALILAGNIPLVGFHDFLSVLISGNNVLVKTSSKDDYLIKFLAKYLIVLDNRFNEKITFVEGKLENYDAVIATGSNNTARYFEYYFRNIPHILRKNRNSVAVLTGTESEEELIAFGHDVFDFYGLGCRNVTKVYLPAGYAFKTLFDVWEKHHAEVAFHNKYINNYNYHKALLLMNLDPHIDAGYILMKERTQLYSPVGMLNYEFYSDIENLGVEMK